MYKRSSLILLSATFCLATMPVQAQAIPITNSQPNKLASAADQVKVQKLNQQIDAYFYKSRYRLAIPLVKQVLEIQRRNLGEIHADIVTSLYKLAYLYRAQGQHEPAEATYKQIFALKRALLEKQNASGEKDGKLSATAIEREELIERVEQHFYRAQYTQATQVAERLLQLQRSAFGEKHLQVADSLNKLGSLYTLQGKFRLAVTTTKQALAMRRSLLGKEHPDVAASMADLAGIYLRRGRYDLAEPLHRQALEIRRKKLGNDRPETADSARSLALLYERQGRYQLAEPLYEQTLKTLKRNLGSQHPHVASVASSLGTVYVAQRKFKLAQPLYEQALKSLRQAAVPNLPELSRTLRSLALLKIYQRRYDLATPLAKESLTVAQQAYGRQHPAIAAHLSTVASLDQFRGDYELADAKYQRSLGILRAVHGENHPNIGNSLNDIAMSHLFQGQYDRAVDFLAQSLEVEEANLQLNLAIGAEAQKRQYIAQVQWTTDAAVSLHLQAVPKSHSAKALALTTLLRRKGRILDASSDHLQTLYRNLDPSNQALLERLNRTRTKLASLYYGGTQLQPAQYRQQLRMLTQTSETMEAQLAKQSNAFKQESQPVTIAAVQAQIPANATLIEFARYRPFSFKPGSSRFAPPRYAAYLLNRAGQMRAVDLGAAAEIEPLVQRFRNALSRRSGEIKRIARQLDAKIMQPVRSVLEQSDENSHLIISPDSQLNLIPFAALVDEQQRYLVESFEISYVTSGRDLLRLQNTEASQAPPLVVANPSYDQSEEAKDDKTVLADGRRSTRSSDLRQLVFGPLPGTAKEAAAIGPKLPNAVVLTAANATENALKQTTAPSILHIATHGFFLPDQPRLSRSSGSGGADTRFSDNTARGGLFRSDIVPTAVRRPQRLAAKVNLQNALLRSGLALAGFNPRQSGMEDGVLTALEVSNLQLRGTQLVVLSACETAVGDVANGEGVYGLRRALVLAGAQSQVISLWKVDDTGTKDLMVGYYDNLLQKQGRSGALRQVQLQAIQSRKYRHPFFWAAFIPSGQWGPLR